MDLSYWGIEAVNIIELNIPNTFGRKFVVDEKYLLKESVDSYGRHVEEKALRLLKEKGISVPEMIGESHVDGGKILTLFHLHKPIIKLEEHTLVKVARGLADISRLDKTDFQKLSVRQESLRESLALISSMVRERADKKTLDASEQAILSLDKDLIPFLQYFNTTLSHGDMHPDNLLMENDKVIFADWETIAIREELFDLAALLGCMAIAEPTDILGHKAKALLSEYVKEAKPTKLAFSLLPELVIASRLKWLCKWLILNNDYDIIRMESDLILMLLENRVKLRSLWLKYADTDFRYSRHKWFLQDAAMMDEVNKAMESLKAEPKNDAQFASDLRQSMIFHGQHDDIISLLKARNCIRQLYDRNKDPHILAEYTIAIGNSCLDLSKFGLRQALDATMKELKKIIDANPDNHDLKIGYAYSLRNNSIAIAEAGHLKTSLAMVAELGRLSESVDELEIKGEYARSLSNAITSLLPQTSQEELDIYFQKLDALYRRYETPKIRAAYQIAKTNMVRAGYRIKT